jgi:hypothetical protein
VFDDDLAFPELVDEENWRDMLEAQVSLDEARREQDALNRRNRRGRR